MVSKGYVAVGGADADAADVNGAWIQPLSAMDSTDNTIQQITSGNSAGSDSGFVTKRTLAIDAAAITNFIIIKADLEAFDSSSDGATPTLATAHIQFTIDSTQKITKTITAGSDRNGRTRSIVFMYTPSAGEKSAGFTIDLDLKLVRAASAGNSATVEANNYYWEVWGA